MNYKRILTIATITGAIAYSACATTNNVSQKTRKFDKKDIESCRKAAEAGVTPKQYVDKIVAETKDLWKLMNMLGIYPKLSKYWINIK